MSSDGQNAPGAETKPRRRWLWVLLGVSLAANLLIIGGAIGHFAFGPHGRGGERLLRGLPSEQREAAREIIREARSTLKAKRPEVRAAYLELETALGAAVFDDAAVDQAARTAFEIDFTMRTEALGQMVRVLRLVDPEQRPKFARFMVRRLQGGYPRGHRRGARRLRD